jgi:hypothetical protein
MTHPTTIDAQALITVTGGNDTDVGGSLKVPAGSGSINYSSRQTPERRNDFNTCMNDRQNNCGWLQSPQSCQSMALQACQGLTGSPQNPQTSGGN